MIKVHGFSCSTVKSLALIIPNIGGKWRRFNVFNLFSRHYIYIYISSVSAHIVPKRVFKNSNEQKEFINKISEQISS